MDFNHDEFNLHFKQTMKNKRTNAIKIIRQNYPGIVIAKEKVSGHNILFAPQNDIVSRTCPLSLRIHSSNQIYFWTNILSGDVFLQCFKCDGKMEILENDNVLNSISGKVEKSLKKHTHTRTQQSEVIFAPTIIVHTINLFDHSTIFMQNDEIRNIYEDYGFIIVPAFKTEKRPINRGWPETTETTDFNWSLYNIAIVCGEKSGVVAVDVDVNENGLKYFQSLCTLNNYNYTTSSFCILTPSGGLHLYFIYDDKISCNRVRLKTDDNTLIGIDIRSNRGCCIAPPSVYTKGDYRFICARRPTKMPQFIRELFTTFS